MPVPSSFTDLSTTPSLNSPASSETVGPNANEYLQSVFSFIKQIYNGTWKPAAAIDLNGQKLTNIAKGTISTSSTDAVRGDQLYTVGEVRMWHGAVASISTTWGPGWYLCDGNHGTANLVDRFIVGAGSTYAMGATGGAATVALSVANMPSHSHGVSDPGHNHGIYDPGHNHYVNDPGHAHSIPGNIAIQGSTYSQEGTNTRLFNLGGWNTNASGTGIWLNSSGTGIGLYASGTGISIQANGSGTAVENRPPYYALCFIEYRGV
ncbi:hypothetical protein [Caballeronia sp. AZ1_KS37]|uniref:hypothetical protein n=1 Tax=Caballeronia sp. AZ1_KS37 TaxID=2921756 RepID=UPI0020291C6C|nr:hypothetical protein [Caballeronia sp. AZ1_KS37]